MPTVFRYQGYRFFFFSNEGQEPPHIHVEKAEGVAKFWLHPDVELAKARRFRKKDVTWLLEVVKQQQEFFLEQWDEHFEDEV
jgi:hypothetical protein